jgi:hypothetical protein
MNPLPRACRTFRAGATVLAIALTAARAGAQAPAPPAAATDGSAANEARSHFERGVTFYDEADYAAALVEFKRAYALAPAWQVLFNIGQSYFQIHDYARALVTMQQFVDQGQDRIPDERRQLVDSERADLANRVGHANVMASAAGTTISIDDVVVGVTPLSAPVLVSVGLRKVVAVHAGDQPVEQEVSVPAGETVDVRFDFPERRAPAAAATPAPAGAFRSVPPAASSRNVGPAVAAFGVGIAGAAVGAVFGELALHDKSRLGTECVGKACAPGSQSDIDAVSRDATISSVAFGVAAVGAVVGVVLWVTAAASAPRSQDGKAPPSSPAARVRFGLGSVAGSF